MSESDNSAEPGLKRLISAFATPIVSFQIPRASSLNRALLQDIKRYQQADAGLKVSNGNGWHSKTDFFERSEPSFRLLGAAIRVSVLKAIGQTSPNLDLSKAVLDLQGWINVSRKGAYNTPHDHSGCQWSGCYYVSVPQTEHDRSGCIEFLDPRTSVTAMTLPGGSFFSPKLTLRPEAGTMLLFPSYLRHWVYPNEEEAERVSIAFNALLKGFSLKS